MPPLIEIERDCPQAVSDEESMDLKTLKVFLTVAQERHFVKAARRLGMTTGGVSNAITRLESRYGVQLVRRTTRSVQLTSDGFQFYRSCQPALQSIEEAEHVLSASRRTPQGKLRVQVPDGFARNVIIPIIGQFLESFPNLNIELESGNATKLHENIDLGIRYGLVHELGVVARPLTLAPMVVCGSPEYLEAHGRPVRPDELKGHKCITYVGTRSGNIVGWSLKNDSKPNSLNVSVATFDGRLFVDNVFHMVSAACAGLGLIQVVGYLVRNEIADGRLESLLERYALPGIPISVVYHPNRFRSPKIRAFIDFLSASLPKQI
jgi:LysR family transcriptional regulator for bpeEF and oprC